jgi:hypothetical protein
MSNEVNIGGSSYGPIANGPRARAIQRDVSINQVAGGESLLGSLAALRDLVERHAVLIPEAGKVRKDLDAIEVEAKSPEIDPPAMRDTILRVIRRVGMVGTVLAAANDLRDLIENLVH